MTDLGAPISGRPYPGPALFVRGGASDFVSDRDWEDIQALFPAAALKTIAKAGHLVHLEHPDLVTELLTGFLGLFPVGSMIRRNKEKKETTDAGSHHP
jgi:esterase